MIEFARVKAHNITEIEGTPGGTTYNVILPGEKEERALCFRRRRADPTTRCTNQAGYGTWHLGTGACKFHGGSGSINPTIVTGRSAVITKTRLGTQIQKYLDMDRSKLLDLTYELAAMRVIFAEFLEKFPQADADDYGLALNRCTTIIGSMGSLVDKMSRVESRNTLTAAQVLYLRAVVADLLMKYIPNPMDREKAAKELAARMGGDIEADNIRPSEASRLPAGAM